MIKSKKKIQIFPFDEASDFQIFGKIVNQRSFHLLEDYSQSGKNRNNAVHSFANYEKTNNKISFNGTTLEWKDSLKYLGVHLDLN